jgi:hypothetical protein
LEDKLKYQTSSKLKELTASQPTVISNVRLQLFWTAKIGLTRMGWWTIQRTPKANNEFNIEGDSGIHDPATAEWCDASAMLNVQREIWPPWSLKKRVDMGYMMVSRVEMRRSKGNKKE